MRVDPEPVERALAALLRAAERHGGASMSPSRSTAPRVSLEPVTAEAAPIVLGESAKDLGAAVAVRLVRALGGEVALDGERLS